MLIMSGEYRGEVSVSEQFCAEADTYKDVEVWLWKETVGRLVQMCIILPVERIFVLFYRMMQFTE